MLDMLKRREVDFVLAFLPLKFNKDIDSRVIFSNRLAAVMKSDHVLAKQQNVKPEELQNHGLVLPAHGLLARRAFYKFLAEKDLNLKVKVEVNNVDLIFQLLHRTNYVSILAESTVLHHENELKAIPIDMPDNQIEGCIHMLKDAYLKNAAQEFIKMLCGSTSILTNFALKDILL